MNSNTEIVEGFEIKILENFMVQKGQAILLVSPEDYKMIKGKEDERVK